MDHLLFTVPLEASGQRLDRFLSLHVPEHSRAALKKAVEAGQCTIDTSPVSNGATKLKAGQKISLLPPAGISSLKAEEGELAIVYHDAHLAVVNKAAGLTVHPCPSCPEGTLVHRLLAHFPELAQQEGLRPGIVHRLDKDTSGLLVVALSEVARLRLSEAFAGREVRKEYLALVQGLPPQEGEIEEPIGRDPHSKVKMTVLPENRGGKPARTAWRVLWHSPDARCTLVAVRIFTGRTHQIRVHMAHLGHPLWGDSLYGGTKQACAQRQMLHAWRIRFTHPMTAQPLEFCCPPPPDMPAAALALAEGLRRVIITGNIGCGKSTLTSHLAALGLPTFSADAEVKRLYEKKAAAWEFLRLRFGTRFMTEEDEINRPALAEAMQHSSDIRHEVESYVHTLVRDALERFWQQAAAAGAHSAVAEVPLYYEASWNKAASAPAAKPFVVVVCCPMPLRHARLAATRGWSAGYAAQIEAWQWPEERKAKQASYCLANDSDEAALERQAQKLYNHLITLRQKERSELAARLAALWTPL